MHKYLTGGVKKKGLGSSQWCPAAGQPCGGHNLKCRKFHLNVKNHFFYSEGSQALEQVCTEYLLSLEILKT